MAPFTFNTTSSVRFGAGLISKLGAMVHSEIGTRVLLVTDPGIMATGLVDKVQACLINAGVEISLFSQVAADPPESVIVAATEAVRLANAEVVIGFGGGSSLDVAKLAAVLAMGTQTLSELYGVGNVRSARLPLILIPTTSGTGSEVTPISIVTTGKSEKMGVVSPFLIPDIALLDPELTLGLPAHVTAATGIDAMVHAIEASASASANNNPVSKILAQEALRLMGAALETAVQSPGDIDARSDMMLGSLLAGQAFANSPVAAVHALAYPIGGHYKVPHGLSNALILPQVLRFNAVTAPELYAEIAACTFPNLAGFGPKEAAAGFAEAMADLSKRCGLQQTLREMGIDHSALPMLARDAMNQTRLLVNNPRDVTEADALAIYEAAW
ncbi:MAG: iron-containing alcohol dehydrogenase [Paracoccaceae bacterium]|nr:iron-containing alcohol dehydrogenase [Paracoccaceae bacterium]